MPTAMSPPPPGLDHPRPLCASNKKQDSQDITSDNTDITSDLRTGAK